MYLEKLEVQGFKSFASKNKLVFPGTTNGDKRGITAVVGPNGSGKSNIADAVRWVLGEQSMKSLRAKMGDDVIFSGSKNKGKSNVAEVSLYLNNQEEEKGGVGKQAPIPYSEMVLTRRVYRSGENEYFINNNRTKLQDIQMLLAKANFGQKTYSVIGQGMVENFLKVSPKERKEFFDEATGIKEFQIKRENSLNKLINSYKNLEQAKTLINEIEPRLKSLTRQVNKLYKKEKLEKELSELQKKYFTYEWHKLNDEFNKYNNEYLKVEEEKRKKENKLVELNNEFNKIQEQKGVSEEFNKWSKIITDLQKEREGVVKNMATLDAKRSLELENFGNFDLSWLENRKKELLNEKSEADKKILELKDLIKEKEDKLKTKDNKINEGKKEVQNLNDKLMDLYYYDAESSSEGSYEKVQNELAELKEKLDEITRLEDISKIKEIINSIKEKIGGLIKSKKDKQDERLSQQNDLKKKLEEYNKSLTDLNEEKNELAIEVNSLKERKGITDEHLRKIIAEERDVAAKIEKYTQKDKKNESGKTEEERKMLDKRLSEIDEKINDARSELNSLGKVEEEKKNKLSELQQKSQSLQADINNLNNTLNDLQTKSAKFETKLEDLEEDIRKNEYARLKEIKENKGEENLDIEEIKRNIEKLKNQLSQIGGIDPETEKEYHQTKEKYDFLTGQIKDLRDAIKSLENVIKELDENIKVRFNKEFKKIHSYFEKYFKILFGGGEAKITTISSSEEEGEEENGSTESNQIKKLVKSSATGIEGIDIQVHPPGKKITSIAVLSGGEKALTAIALICAIISANPSPFVVLDEVDAALDEANSERFAKILDDLSYKTQFICITHNRASMHKANVLYGTTMNEDGISKLLSIKMEEGEQMQIEK